VARENRKRVSARPQVNITDPSVITQVNAQPVDTSVRQPFIAPQRQEPKQYTELRQLAIGLGSLSEGLQQFGNAQAQADLRQQELLLKKQREEEIRRAELMAQSFKGTPMEALSAISPESSPIFQETYTAQLGAKYGLEAQQAFAQHAADNYDQNNNDPRYSRTFADSFFGEYIKGVNDPRFLQSYQERVSKTVTDFVNGSIRDNIQQVEDNKQGMLMTKAMSHFTDPKRPDSWLDDLKAEFSMLNMRRGDIEQQVFQAAATYAVQNGDPALLESFIKPTADGLPGYALRGGDNAAAWQQAMARAQKALDEGMKANTEGIRAVTKNTIQDQLQAFKNGMAPLVEPEEFEANLLQHFQEKRLKGSDVSSYYKDYLNTYWETKALDRFIPQALDGRIATAGVPKDKLGYVLDKAVSAQLNAIGKAGDPQAIEAQRLYLAKTNGIIHPDHQKLFIDAAYAPVSKADGKEQIPDRVKQAMTLAYSYYNDKNGRDNFIRNIEDKRAAYFWSNLFDRAQHNGHNLEAAYLFTKELPLDKRDWIKAEPSAVKELLNKSVEKLDVRGFWNSGKDFADNFYARNWIEEEIREYVAINPNASPEEIISGASSAFAGSHRMIEVDGRKQLIDISHLPTRPTDDDMEAFEKGLTEYKRVFLRDSGLKEFYGIKDENVDSVNISLKPVPQSVRGDTGTGNYLVLINDAPTGMTIDFETFLKQSQSKDFLTASQIHSARETLSKIEEHSRSKSILSPEEFDRVSEDLKHFHSLGVIGSKEFDKANDRLKSWSSDFKTQRLLQAESSRLQQIIQSPVKNLLQEPSAIDVMYSSLPNTPDPTSQEARVLVDKFMSDKKYGEALATAVWGRSNIAYKDEQGNFRVGYGYKIDKDLTQEKIDFSRALIPASFIGLGHEGVLEDLKAGSKRLSGSQPEYLLKYSFERAQKRALDIIGEETFSLLPENTKAALSVLAMTTDTANDFSKAIDRMQDGKWDSISELMTEVPSNRRKSALGFIRAMASNPQTFKYLANKK